VLRVEDREGLIANLNEAGIGTGIHYPVPLHLQKAYRVLNYRKGDFPVCERIAGEIVSLPMHPQLTAEQQSRVVEQVLRFTTEVIAPKKAAWETVPVTAVERTA
jgi:dTDP-4-amino-4,6-dideoxygalactose transaminase